MSANKYPNAAYRRIESGRTCETCDHAALVDDLGNVEKWCKTVSVSACGERKVECRLGPRVVVIGIGTTHSGGSQFHVGSSRSFTYPVMDMDDYCSHWKASPLAGEVEGRWMLPIIKDDTSEALE